MCRALYEPIFAAAKILECWLSIARDLVKQQSVAAPGALSILCRLKFPYENKSNNSVSVVPSE